MSSNERRAEKLAAGVRADHGLGHSPIKDLFEFVQTVTGVDALSMSAPEAEHGLSMCDPATGRTFIVVMTTPSPMRQRSTIAHELCHVLNGDLQSTGPPLEPGVSNGEEILANAFARHLLIPMQGVRQHLEHFKGDPSTAHLSHLVQEYEVSPAIAAIQLRDASFIDQNTYLNWKTISTRSLAVNYGWLPQYENLKAASQRERSPQGLMTRAVEGYRRGALGLPELTIWYPHAAEEIEQRLDNSSVAEMPDDADFDTPLFPDETSGTPT